MGSGIIRKRPLIYIISSPFLAKYLGLSLLYASIFLSISYVLIKNYLNRLVEKNRRRFEMLEIEKEREIYHSKIEFFTNIAHEIRTPLTLIKMPLDKLMKKQNNNTEINVQSENYGKEYQQVN